MCSGIGSIGKISFKCGLLALIYGLLALICGLLALKRGLLALTRGLLAQALLGKQSLFRHKTAISKFTFSHQYYTHSKRLDELVTNINFLMRNFASKQRFYARSVLKKKLAFSLQCFTKNHLLQRNFACKSEHYVEVPILSVELSFLYKFHNSYCGSVHSF